VKRALLACALALATSAAAAPAPRVLAPVEKVGGKRVDAYPALWWQWANRKRWGAQPFQDRTGAQCRRNQSGPVWFLAGTDGTDEVHRNCQVPTGKHIFLPVITMLERGSCVAAKQRVRENNEHVVATEISVDGKAFALAPLRMSSDCFDAYAQADFLEEGDRHAADAATDGYWLMLAPLADGEHRIRVKVRYDNPGASFGDMEQDFEYRLQVGGPEPGPEENQPDEDEDEGELRQA